MKKYLQKFSTTLIVLLSIFVIQGCTDHEQVNANNVLKQAKMQKASTDKVYQELKSHVSDSNKKGKYEQTMLIAIDKIVKEMPDSEAVKDMANQFKTDTTKNGMIWKTIEKEYKELEKFSSYLDYGEEAPKNKVREINNAMKEYASFSSSNNLNRFDERFIDYINTLAAISSDIQPVIVDTLDKTAPVGSAFVGNPQYGEWKENSDGSRAWSFLETYMYLSFLDNTLNNRGGYGGYNDYRRGYGSRNYYSSNQSSYGYSNWSNKRNYSYYNDVYVQKYAKPAERRKYRTTQSNLTKKYAKSLKPNTNIQKQIKTIKPKNRAFQSSLVKKKTTNSTSGKNTGASSGKRSASQSNLARKSSSAKNSSKFKSSAKSVRLSSKSVSIKRGK